MSSFKLPSLLRDLCRKGGGKILRATGNLDDTKEIVFFKTQQSWSHVKSQRLWQHYQGNFKPEDIPELREGSGYRLLPTHKWKNICNWYPIAKKSYFPHKGVFLGTLPTTASCPWVVVQHKTNSTVLICCLFLLSFQCLGNLSYWYFVFVCWLYFCVSSFYFCVSSFYFNFRESKDVELGWWVVSRRSWGKQKSWLEYGLWKNTFTAPRNIVGVAAVSYVHQ